MATQTASMLLAFVLAALTLTHQVQVGHIYLLAALLGVVNAFDVPARQAFVVEMVGKEDLVNAIALNSSVFNSARIIGPAIGGVLVAAIGEGWCFLANAISYMAVILGLLLMKMEPRKEVFRSGSALSSIVEGFGYVWKTGPIRALLVLLGLVSLLGLPYLVLMPIFAAQILHGGAKGLGTLMGASGVGSLIAALIPGGPAGCARFGTGGGLFHGRIWGLSHPVLLVPFLLAFCRPARSGRFLHDNRNGRLKHADSNFGVG